MNKDMLRIILFAFLIDKYVNEQKTWKAASDECDSNGLEFDENVLKNIDDLLDKELWIGKTFYRVITPWIEILGVSRNMFCQQNESSSYNISGCIDESDLNYSFVYKVLTGHVSDNGDEESTTLFCSTNGNGLKSANCNDTTDTARTSRCSKYLIN
ncbi:unnamed protein product [Mytilus coruscus]|uniref:C-type lectin domain-containing protein n=1 Tax=Mytilus coruscus TaxID=42192 RepID=A0A6J8EQI2_MYTCO|nr:unnamed protein product [Mytilus coruscus]